MDWKDAENISNGVNEEKKLNKEPDYSPAPYLCYSINYLLDNTLLYIYNYTSITFSK